MKTPTTTPSKDSPTVDLQKDQITRFVGGSTVPTTTPRTQPTGAKTTQPEVKVDEVLATARRNAQALCERVEKIKNAEPEWNEIQPKLVKLLETAVKATQADAIDKAVAKVSTIIVTTNTAIRERKQREEEQRQREEEQRQAEEERRAAEEEARKLAEAREKVQKLKEKIAGLKLTELSFAERLGKFDGMLDKIHEQPTAEIVDKHYKAISEKFLAVEAEMKKHAAAEEERRKKAEENFKARWAKLSRGYLIAKRVPKFNDGTTKARKALDAAYAEVAKALAAKEFTEATEALDLLFEAFRPFGPLGKQFTTEKKEYYETLAKLVQ